MRKPFEKRGVEMSVMEELENEQERKQFIWHDFVVIRSLFDPDDVCNALAQARNNEQKLADTGLGRILEAAKDKATMLGIRASHSSARQRQSFLPWQTHELPDRSEVVYSTGRYGIAVITSLQGRLWVWSHGGRSSELLEPGDVAFVAATTYHLKPYKGEEATALVISQQQSRTVI